MSKKTITETTEKTKPKYTKEAFFEKYRPLLETHNKLETCIIYDNTPSGLISSVLESYLSYVLLPNKSKIAKEIKKDNKKKDLDWYSDMLLSGYEIKPHKKWTYCKPKDRLYVFSYLFKGNGIIIGWDCFHSGNSIEKQNLAYNRNLLIQVTKDLQKYL